MVVRTDAVAHPGTMVIESSHTAITNGTVLRADGPSNEAGGTEDRRSESCATALLRQLQDGAHPLVVGRLNDAWIAAPQPPKAPPQHGTAEGE